MKVLFITNSLPPAIDGVGDYTFRLIESLYHSFTGNEYHVITKAQISRKIQEELKNVKFHKVENWNIKSYLKIASYLKKEKIDILHLQYVPYSFNYYGAPLLLAFFFIYLSITNSSLKKIITLHEVRVKITFKHKNTIIGLLQWLCAKIFYYTCNKSITSNLLYANLIASHKKNKISIIPVGNNLVNFRYMPEVQVQENHSALYKISCFGQSIKSYKLILDSLTNLSKGNHHIQLKLLGSIKEVETQKIKKYATEQGISDNIFFSGKLEPKDIMDHLKQSDIFIALEDLENFTYWRGVSFKSGALAAAICALLPIITSQGELTDNVLMRQCFIKICNPEATDIANKIKETLKGSVEEKQICKLSQKSFFEENISWNNICNEHTQIYKQII